MTIIDKNASGVLATVAGSVFANHNLLDVSADGRFVAFLSNATNLHPNDTEFDNDVFIKDVVDGSVELVGDGLTWAKLSGDGRTIATIAQVSGVWTISVTDLGPGETASDDELVATVPDANTPLDLSADGTVLVFPTQASLSPLDTDSFFDVYWRDLDTGTTELVSATASCEKATNSVFDLFSMTASGRAIAADNTTVLFKSNASNLGVGDGYEQAYVKSVASCGPVDADGDGVPDGLDVPGAAVAFSDAAPPALGQGTFGVITETNGLTVSMEDVVPGGVAITALCPGDEPGDAPSCSVGPIKVRPCGLAMTLSLDPGDSVTVSCGSVTITAETGAVTVEAGAATITIPNGVTATLTQRGRRDRGERRLGWNGDGEGGRGDRHGCGGAEPHLRDAVCVRGL